MLSLKRYGWPCALGGEIVYPLCVSRGLSTAARRPLRAARCAPPGQWKCTGHYAQDTI